MLVRILVHDPLVHDKVSPAHVRRSPVASSYPGAHSIVEAFGQLAEHGRRENVVDDQAGKVLLCGDGREPKSGGLSLVVSLTLEKENLWTEGSKNGLSGLRVQVWVRKDVRRVRGTDLGVNLVVVVPVAPQVLRQRDLNDRLRDGANVFHTVPAEKGSRGRGQSLGSSVTAKMK